MMSARIRRFRALAALVPVALVVLACGASSTVAGVGTSTPSLTLAPTATPTPAPNATLTEVSATKQVANSAQGSFSDSASCPAGQVMVSGGYSITGGTNAQQSDVLSSFPSSATTWSVAGLNASVGGPLTLTVFADCLQTTLSVAASIASSGPGGGTVTAACPAGAVVSGGGYDGSGEFSSFAATASGWAATLAGSGSTKVYALCLTGGPQAGSTPNASANIASGGAGTAAVACASGQLLVGGGYSTTPPSVVFTSAGNSTLTQWQVQASDRSFGSMSGLTVTARAVCLTL